jgi:hypothetical protein
LGVAKHVINSIEMMKFSDDVRGFWLAGGDGSGLSQFHSSKSFEYLLDVLDSNEAVDENDAATTEGFSGNQSRFCSCLPVMRLER